LPVRNNYHVRLMQSILDKFRPQSSAFRPANPQEVFALRLAQKLGEATAVHHYVSLSGEYSPTQLLCAYRRAVRAFGNGQRGQRFHKELERIQSNGNHNNAASLIAVRIERRAVAAAIFHGDHLEYTDARQLSSAHDKALASAVGFVNWLLENFPVDSAVLESSTKGYGLHRQGLHDAICAVLRERAIPIWEITKAEQFNGLGHHPAQSRKELRQIATDIWPILAGTHAKVFIQDAAILGLHVQTERLFIIN